MTIMQIDLSDLQYEYLTEIYEAALFEWDGGGDYIASSTLAERLLTSQSNVNRIIDSLRERDLIEHERYVGVRLTEYGRTVAADIVRRRAVIEAFLMAMMGFEWHAVYAEARKMCKGVNETLSARMWALAGHPERGPYGDWIVQRNATEDDERLLAEAEVDGRYEIRRVLTRQEDRLVYLDALELKPLQTLLLIHKAPFDGPLQIQLGQAYRVLGRQLAALLTVVPAR